MTSRNYDHWFFAIFYAYVYVFLIPWTEIWGDEFFDIGNYLFRIEYLHQGGEEGILHGIQWLLDEPLWELIIIGIGYFDDYRLALYLISFISMVFYGAFLFKRVEFYVVMLLLFNPLSVNLFVEQVRMALAFSLVLFAYDFSSRRLQVFMLLVAFFIHASMPLFYAIYYMLYKLNEKVEPRKYYLLAIFLAIGLALFMKFGIEIILTTLGDRHAGNNDAVEGSSIAYSIIWFALAFLIATFGDFSDKKERIFVAYAITIMSFFFFASALGIFAARFVAVLMPLIIIAIGSLPKHYKQGTYVILVAFNLFLFKYWVAMVIL